MVVHLFFHPCYLFYLNWLNNKNFLYLMQFESFRQRLSFTVNALATYCFNSSYKYALQKMEKLI